MSQARTDHRLNDQDFLVRLMLVFLKKHFVSMLQVDCRSRTRSVGDVAILQTIFECVPLVLAAFVNAVIFAFGIR